MTDQKIGWISAAAYATTGYGRMCKEICSRLILDEYNIINIGGIGSHNVWGGKMDYPTGIYLDKHDLKIVEDSQINKSYIWLNRFEEAKIPIIPTVGQLAGEDIMDMLIHKYEFDTLIAHWDCFAVGFLQRLNVYTMIYVPIDGPFTQTMFDLVKENDKVVAFSRYGYKELEKWFNRSKIDYIPHGIHTEVWKPIEETDRYKIRKERFGIDNDEFLILSVGANVGERKQLPLMMLVFKKLLEQYPKCTLFLFTNPNMAFPKGYNLVSLAAELGIKDKVRFPKYDPIIESWDNLKMIELFAVSDVYLTASLAEGFGVPMLEAMACGTPVIGPNSSTIPELVEGHGWVYDINPDYLFAASWIPTLQFYPIPSMNSMLLALMDAKQNRDKVIKNGEKSREFALKYDWTKIMPLWRGLFERAENERSVYG